jgi:hypothetical protein
VWPACNAIAYRGGVIGIYVARNVSEQVEVARQALWAPFEVSAMRGRRIFWAGAMHSAAEVERVDDYSLSIDRRFCRCLC